MYKSTYKCTHKAPETYPTNCTDQLINVHLTYLTLIPPISVHSSVHKSTLQLTTKTDASTYDCTHRAPYTYPTKYIDLLTNVHTQYLTLISQNV